jgi:hypothetical protein
MRKITNLMRETNKNKYMEWRYSQCPLIEDSLLSRCLSSPNFNFKFNRVLESYFQDIDKIFTKVYVIKILWRGKIPKWSTKY